MLSILWFLNQVFKPYNLQVIGQMIAMASIYGLAVVPMWKLFKFFHVPGRIEKVKPVRMYATLALLAVIFAAIFFIPFPFRVWGNFELQAHDAKRVFVEVPGALSNIHDVKHGDRVKEGQPLVTLENIDLLLTKQKLAGQLAQQEAKLDHLSWVSRQSVNNEEALASIEAAEKALETLEIQLQKRTEQLEKLSIVSPGDGIILPSAGQAAQKGRIRPAARMGRNSIRAKKSERLL